MSDAEAKTLPVEPLLLLLLLSSLLGGLGSFLLLGHACVLRKNRPGELLGLRPRRLHAEAFVRGDHVRAILTLDKKRTSYHKAQRTKQRCFFVVRRDHLSPGKHHYVG